MSAQTFPNVFIVCTPDPNFLGSVQALLTPDEPVVLWARTDDQAAVATGLLTDDAVVLIDTAHMDGYDLVRAYTKVSHAYAASTELAGEIDRDFTAWALRIVATRVAPDLLAESRIAPFHGLVGTDLDELRPVVQAVFADDEPHVVAPSLVSTAAHAYLRPAPEPKLPELTPKQMVVLNALLDEPDANQDVIAGRLLMSVHTLTDHLSQMRHKLGVSKTRLIVDAARKAGLIPTLH